MIIMKKIFMGMKVEINQIMRAGKVIERDSREAHSYLRYILLSRRIGCLSNSNSNSTNVILSSFLLRKSRRDPNEWRRNFRIVVNDQLWYGSRMLQRLF